MDETFTYTGNPAGDPGNVQSFDGGDGNDTIHIFFDGETAAAPIVTDFTEHPDGSFTATYRSTQNGGVNEDRVTITNIENVHIVLRNAYGPNSFPAPSNDIIRTGHGDDFISTAGGNDIIDSGRGVDTVDGGTGGDEFSESDVISKDFSDVETDISWNIQTGAFAGPGSFTNLEAFGTLLTGGGNDTIVSSSLANNSGLPGNEILFTGAGNDTVTVANGIDDVDLGTGDDRLIVDYRNALTPGPLVSILNQNADGSYSGEHRGTQNSGTQTGVTFEGVEHFTIFSAGFSDTIITGDGDDFVSGGAGNDRIDVGKGIDQADGGAGDQFANADSISKDFSDVSTDVSWNLQTNEYSGPGSFTNFEAFGTLVTGGGNDTIVSGTLGNGSGLPGNETISTGAGNDSVTVANALDHVDLGAGEDRLIVDYRNANFPGVVTSVVTQNPDGSYSGEHRGSADSGNRTGVTFENAEHFTIYSSGSSDNLITGDGDDIVFGGLGNDRIDVGKGIDHVDGGGGDQFSNGDSVSKDFSDVDTDIVWNIQANTFSGPGSFVNLEAFGTLVTGSGNDTIVTSRLSNGSGLPGNEKIFTGAGDDVVSVYFANDFVDMGSGNDRLVVDYAAFQSAGNVVMTLNETSPGTYSGFVDPAGSSTDVTFAGVEHFTILLQGGFDTIVTGNGDDIISTDVGNDTVDAGGGTDSIEGGGGDDTIDGGDGNDHIDGGAQNDRLEGGAGDDVIVGGDGTDTIVLSGNRADYRISQRVDGALIIADLRDGSPDGTDTVSEAERFAFADGLVAAENLDPEPDTSPFARDDDVATDEDVLLNGSLFADNGNGPDSDPDDPLTVAEVNGNAASVGTRITLASGALLTVNADGTFSYDPNGRFNYLVSAAKAAETGTGTSSAVDSFTYTLAGGGTATVEVTVNGVDSGDDQLPGNSGDDTITGTDGGEMFVLDQGGDDDVAGGGGYDIFYFGDAYTNGDNVDGGDGFDSIFFRGDYNLTFDADAFTGVEKLAMLSGDGADFDYSFTTIDANVAAGERLLVEALMLEPDEDFVFVGYAETDGFFKIVSGPGDDILVGGARHDEIIGGAGDDTIYGGAGRDRIAGGLGSDFLFGGAGRDRFLYDSAAESTSQGFDTLDTFQSTFDKIDLPFAVSGWAAPVGSGQLDSASFDADLAAALNAALGVNGAVQFTPDSGDYAGRTFVVIDADGDGDYAAGADYVFEFTNPVTPLDAANFFV